ncbi:MULTISPECIES: hypothetical protein [unclassified Meridianimarinicoccus]|uniref:hypothetical protein n=1 Tax=unclassified Meridianimarinicoccus TaxID=2923344 RepID=UPI00186772F5|nr:hypothetical protein [Fluviibacterium sp. MJW13]
MSRPVLIYRLVVLALTAFYFADRFRVEDFGNMAEFGWQFRYLTIWALTGSLVAAALMLVPALGRPGPKAEVFVSVVAVVNMIVVVSYWRLYFTDPTLVMGDKQIVAYREYYLHLLGPLLQWIDVLWIKRAFRWPLRVALWLGVLVLAYVVWAEGVVHPLNAEPVGSVTNGLPYPFLNDMVLAERAVFYGVTFASGLVFLLVLWAAQLGLNRLRRV